jgi:hypothetical protein
MDAEQLHQLADQWNWDDGLTALGPTAQRCLVGYFASGPLAQLRPLWADGPAARRGQGQQDAQPGSNAPIYALPCGERQTEVLEYPCRDLTWLIS